MSVNGGAFSMTLHPKNPKDMALAPVAAEIDFNLQGLRDKRPTKDGCRLHMTGGSVSLDLGLGASIMEYIEAGIV